ncbi:MAG: porin family protein [Bauldia sp.]|nr:porin family protein [Bauldia sp.]
MKKILVAAAVAAAFTGPALAADIAPPPPPVVEPAPQFSWVHTIYIGGQLGYGLGYKDWDYIGPNTHQVRGLLAGVQGGINVRRGNLVVGAEADWNWSNIIGSADCPVMFTCISEINWIATWTARAGIMAGPALLYLEGGVAVANETFTDITPVETDIITVRNLGWTVGGGAEFSVGTNWAIDLEYSYVDFGTDTYDGLSGELIVTQSLHMVRLGVNRLF